MTDESDDGDESVRVRDEDAFDVGAVSAWLREHAAPEFAHIVAGVPEVRQFPGGASNLTYLLRYPAGELILRRPPVGAKAKGAHDMGREFRIQSALRPVFPVVPAMVSFCDDDAVIGSDFYVMDKVDGTILRRELPWPLAPAEVSVLCGRVWEVLTDLHAVDVDDVPGLAALGRGEGYVARQVAGWTDRLSRAATDDLGDWSDITAWLSGHQPGDVAQRLIHNDYRLDNVVLAPEPSSGSPSVVAVLDWEMATVGDPLMDLGGSMAYRIEAGDSDFLQRFRRQPSHVPGMWTRAQIVDRYAERSGLSVTPQQWRFYEVFGVFRLAVIAQQIWYRYFHRQTTNEAYAVFGPAVRELELRCRALLEA
ncbi:MAG: phosphotransferase family protein [Nocardioides sp.]